MQDSAAELVLDGRVVPPPPRSGSRGPSGILARALSSMLPVDHKAAARALEEDEDEEDQRVSPTRPLNRLEPMAHRSHSS